MTNINLLRVSVPVYHSEGTIQITQHPCAETCRLIFVINHILLRVFVGWYINYNNKDDKK